uniref:Transmembrane protein n=1 Tax=Periphykon beckeri TaxID=2006982 RepID=A0A1Z1M2U7_9FLOR|nr:hypothetical protein [Periphykon beckeri]ARW60389.1 hypothetical protein [Periphykon beckeri]
MNFLYYITSIIYIDLNFNRYYKQYVYLLILNSLVILLFLPYLSIKVLVFITIFIQVIMMLVFRNLYIIKLIKIFKKIIYFSLLIIMFDYCIKDKYNEHQSISNISIIYYLRIKILSCTKIYACKISIYLLCYTIYKYLKQIIILNGIYILTFYTILIFIKSETIQKAILITYITINKLQVRLYNTIILNITVSNQILEKTVEYTNNIWVGTQIKNSICTKTFITYISYYINKLYNQLVHYESHLNITLLTRYTQNKFNTKIYID